MEGIWIRSQNKEVLVKATCITVHRVGFGDKLSLVASDYTIGIYPEVRCLEIIDEIESHLTVAESAYQNQVKVYHMPQS